MSVTPLPGADPVAEPRLPRIALMGEFSAGKSTLANLLVGGPVLPVRTTATQAPPVWLSHGVRDPFRVDLKGGIHPLDLTRIDSAPLEDTSLIRVFREADILTICDLIDMPGISDPNMDSAIWERQVQHVDAVIWCTHATQAWRQSEAAVWAEMPSALHAKSLLLVTRWDKILSEADRARILARLTRETEGRFGSIHPISLTQALAAETDPALWHQSGAQGFVEALVDLVRGPPPEPALPQVSPRRVQAKGRRRSRPPRAVPAE